ncbi:unnamed protein product [Calypogeia fissa]
MTTVPRGEKVQGRLLTAEARAGERAGELIPEAHAGELIPGIEDDITVAHIATKLTLRDMYVFSSVSRGWLQAIRSRRVYNARLHHDSTETCVLLGFEKDNISLCSVKDHSIRKLQQGREGCLLGILAPNGVVALDGRVYAVGPDGKLHVLDLAGQQQWKRCSKGEVVLSTFELEVMDGKIYALAHCNTWRTPRPAYVFDLKQNTRSSIKPMPSTRFGHQVAAMGDELVVYGGIVSRNGLHFQHSYFLDVYHPVKDEWRAVESFGRPDEMLFVAQGRFYSMSAREIHVYDGSKNSWTCLHSFCFDADQSVEPIEVVAAGNELLARVTWYTEESRDSSCLFHCREFGGQNKELLWHAVVVFPGIRWGNCLGPTVSL